MNIKNIIRFCETFNIELDNVSFVPGWKREIFMCFSDEDWAKFWPKEENFTDNSAYESAIDTFQNEWFCLGECENSLNVY